ncbi:MAG TPA: tetratricopeptide repeat protein [Terriglobales bacterium]|nr:tetratricopeptide repeat protein [Terriglobales bacterium]
MTKTIFISFIFILAFASIASAQTDDLAPGAISSFLPQKSGDRVEEAYAAGKNAMYAGDWQKMLDSYSQVVKAGGAHADEALYWQAYAQHKLGRAADALNSIAQFKRQYPRSKWLNDVSALELEVRPSTAQTMSTESDCDLKILAVNSLMNTDPDRALPILEKLLGNNGNAGQCGGKILEKALFVLSQSDDPQARDLMLKIATGKLHPELQQKAIHYLGISGNHETLMKIYTESTSADAKRSALHSLGISGGCKELLTLSGPEKDASLVREAIHSMGIAGCRDQLRDLYSKATSPDVKRDLLHSTIVSGDTELQEKVAHSDPDPKMRAEAVKDLGISGGCKQLTDFAGEKDPDVMHSAIHAMGVGGCRDQLRDLYSKTTNRDLKSDILHATIVSGDTELQEKVALSDPDPELRATAIKDLGISGGSSATLMNIYQSNQSSDVRDAAINALFIKGDAHSLVELARKETNPELRKEIVGKLSVMGSREANDYLMEILNK